VRTLFRRVFFHHQRGYRSLAFVLTGTVALGAYTVVEHIPDHSVPGWVLSARKRAVQTAIRGQQVIGRTRTARGLPFNAGDRFHTGLIGVASSPVTTDLGSLASHRTSTEPAFAAAVVMMLWRAGVRPGDLVAVGMTGSYPGFDLDVFAATDAVGATPIVISSVGASQYGADDTALTWQDMEGALFHAGVIRHRSTAVAAGGSLVGTSALFRERLAQRSGLPVVPVLPLSEDIRYRLQLYLKAARQKPAAPWVPRPGRIAAFIDVGGASANIGSSSAEAIIPAGYSRPRWTRYEATRLGLVGAMDQRGVPIIALIDVGKLAKRFGIPWDPHLPPTAKDIAPSPPNPFAVALALLVLVSGVVVLHRRGFFRVPNWELPAGLRLGLRKPSEPADLSLAANRSEP
jgi:poly-gamma-glutamate system protein